ncbi:hypothetical protein BJY04DRAFT_182561 [Aspergillus karnatakaensis]|uniref:uncharacterized protein n=1 Tax=Aspergillus karnatakaensis TaxID=1810916 RepID=UPI003CCE1C0C
MSSKLVLPGIGENPVVPFVLASFVALVYYNAAELIVLTLARFKRRGSLYFWCLLVTSLSLIPHNTGFVLLFFRPDVSRYIAVSLITTGWCGTVTGHSLVLWSRLHFVLHNNRLLNGLLVLICVDAFLLCIPTTALLFGSVSPDLTISDTFSAGYNIMERIQLVGFCIQEATLSGIYVWETAKLLRLRPEHQHNRILAQLLAINIIVLFIDFTVVVIEYVGFYAVQVMFKPVAYSIKLKLEYAVLGRLVQIAQRGAGDSVTPEFETVPSSIACERRLGGCCTLGIREGILEREVLKRCG